MPQASAELILDSLPAEEVFGYLAEARSNVKQTHLRNKLLPFSVCSRPPSRDKGNLFGNMRRRKHARFTFRSAPGNVMIPNLRPDAVQTDAASPDYFKCSSCVRLVFGIKSFSLTAAHFSLPFSFKSAVVSAESYFPPFSLNLCASCIHINAVMVFFFISPPFLSNLQSVLCVYGMRLSL